MEELALLRERALSSKRQRGVHNNENNYNSLYVLEEGEILPSPVKDWPQPRPKKDPIFRHNASYASCYSADLTAMLNCNNRLISEALQCKSQLKDDLRVLRHRRYHLRK